MALEKFAVVFCSAGDDLPAEITGDPELVVVDRMISEMLELVSVGNRSMLDVREDTGPDEILAGCVGGLDADKLVDDPDASSDEEFAEVTLKVVGKDRIIGVSGGLVSYEELPEEVAADTANSVLPEAGVVVDKDLADEELGDMLFDVSVLCPTNH